MIAMSGAELTIRQRLAANVRQQRLERGWSQEDLAVQAELHHNQISSIERARSSVGIDLVEKLARALKVKAGDLLD